jgi:phosphate transport system protein
MREAPAHTRRTFSEALDRVRDDVLVLGALASGNLRLAVVAVLTHDRMAAERLIVADQRVNEWRHGVEELSLQLIATQQPVARDMRLLAAVLEIASDLERIGDYAKGIARLCLRMHAPVEAHASVKIDDMTTIVLEMIDATLSAFADLDSEAAAKVVQRDDEVDARYEELFRMLVRPDGRVSGGEADLEETNYVLWVAHNLERAGDRATNICERVVYIATGR